MDEPFWIESPSVLFHTFELVPTKGDALSTQLNSLARLVILVSVGVAFYSSHVAIGVFLFGMGLLFLLHNANKQPIREYFNPRLHRGDHLPKNEREVYTEVSSPIIAEGMKHGLHHRYNIRPTGIPRPHEVYHRSVLDPTPREVVGSQTIRKPEFSYYTMPPNNPHGCGCGSGSFSGNSCSNLPLDTDTFDPILPIYPPNDQYPSETNTAKCDGRTYTCGMESNQLTEEINHRSMIMSSIQYQLDQQYNYADDCTNLSLGRKTW